MKTAWASGLAAVAVALTAMGATGASLTPPGMAIAEDGLARVAIVVVSNAPAAERHAAGELAAYLGKVTGARFEVGDPTNSSQPRILVGAGAAKRAEPSFDPARLGPEGIVMKMAGRDLILAGGSPRGTLYAVYTFLEDQVGCRWWTSTAETVPSRPILVVGALDVAYTPPFEYREPFYFDAFDADWAVRNKANGYRNRIDDKRGGRNRFAQFVHTFYRYVSPTNYFEKHPEWFSERDGKRIAEKGQLCLSNPEMTAEFIRQVKADLKAKPLSTMVSVSQNDWNGYCACKACAAVDAEEGGPSGSILRFVNRVAEGIEPEFPNVLVCTLAYTYSQKPPKLARPRRNVSVWLCSINCSQRIPLADQSDRPFRQDLLDWSQICDRLYVWDYVVNFIHFTLPHPNLRVLGPNLRFFKASGVKGVFEQGAYKTGGTELAELRAWVLAKLLWNPALDDRALVKEFVEGYYGQAAPFVTAYLDETQVAAAGTDDLLGCYSRPTEKFLNAAVLVRACGLLARAEEAVKDDPLLLQRVKTARLPILYLALVRWTDLRKTATERDLAWPLGNDIRAVLEEYKAIARAADLTQTGEHREGFGWLEGVVAESAGGLVK